MKKRKKTLQKICSILVLMVLTLTSIKAAGGSIAIDLKDLPQAEVEKAGVTFTLYKVGTMSDDGRAKLYERYGMSLPNTAEGLQKAAKELMERSGKEKVGKQVTDANGHLSFDDIGNGIYLLVPSDMETYGTIDPFLVTLPMYEELGSGIQGPSYDLQIEPKASPNKEPIEPTPPLDPDEPDEPVTPDTPDTPDTPNTPDEPNPPLKPEEPDIPTDSDHPNGPHKPQTPETPDTSTTTDGHEGPKKDVTTTQTGDASRKGLYALLIMLSAFGMYIVYSKHRRGSELSDEK
ncbi:pilin N-terminal domain-containing protein [Longicatena caecimuris]|uniref:Uncharacterized protein n=1 Tax=Longicatena caecimuris TaxID=1796635 RepID=A0A4R3TDC2_9FIRM|nr:pilin N-terminal domain-containing protein [Longicatena caecimuris]MCR1870421.1 pilin N-terminal domain-containing protein [Longicatena caecimuris]MCU0101667.1 pilin N-terminal domain-containing protein [Longicatena caecimuris]TCU59007.1 hypothetical protein EDD61_11235 [Longicatena caecimuris]